MHSFCVCHDMFSAPYLVNMRLSGNIFKDMVSRIN